MVHKAQNIPGKGNLNEYSEAHLYQNIKNLKKNTGLSDSV